MRGGEPDAGVGRAIAALLVIVAGAAVSIWWWSTAAHFVFDPSGTPARAASVLEVASTTPMPTDAAAPVAPSPPAATAAYCAPGQAPAFQLGFAALQQQLGDVMGTPLECEHGAPGGDTVQQTSTGLAIWRRSTNLAMFTDGWRHWALTPRGVVTWTGDAIDPPTTNAATPTPTPMPTAAPSTARMRVVNTDGEGVVLRSAPQANARTPRGLLEGALVTVIGRSGSDWVHVRADNGLDGWVPGHYLTPAA